MPPDPEGKTSESVDKLNDEWSVDDGEIQEPRAEARMQLDYFNQVKLKVIKSDHREENKTLASSKAPITEKISKPFEKKPRVFSQVRDCVSIYQILDAIFQGF